MDNFFASRFNTAPISLEEPFSLPFEAAIVCGRIDALFDRGERVIEIVDFKSGSGRPVDVMESSLQLPLYGLWASERFERDPSELTYTYFFLRDAAEVTFSPTPEAFSAVADRVRGLVASIQAGEFDPLPGCTCQACRPAE